MQYYEFANYKIYPATRKFFRQDVEIGLRDRDFDVLIFLIENRSNIVSKDEIIRVVWSGTIVEDNSVERAVVNIRKALRDDASNPSFVKTVRGRGYLFIAEVREVQASPISFDSEIAFFGDNEANQSSGRLTVLTPKMIIGFLAVALAGFLFWNGGDVYRVFTRTMIFSEQFSDRELGNDKWIATGRSVRISNGKVKITVDEMGKGGKLLSKYFSYDPKKSITIESRIKVSFNQNINEYVRFQGVFGLLADKEDSPADTGVLYGVKYGNAVTEFEREGKVTTQGFYLIRDNGDIFEEFHHCNGSVGPRVAPLWGKWFEQKIVYDPQSGTMAFFIDGKEKGEFFVGPVPFGEQAKLRLVIYPRGAWLHHSIEVDYLSVTQ